MTHPKRFHRVLTALRSSSVATALVSFASGFFSKLSAFRTARGANVAVTFALATLPIVTAVGAAVDYSHANAVKAALQSALDSTALMLAKNAATVTNSALQTEALSYFNGLFTAVEATNVAVDATYTSSGGSRVLVNGSVDVPTSFMGVVGVNRITVKGSATTSWGSARLRVALVLDNTGSMTQTDTNGTSKISALKTASHNLLTMLQNSAQTAGDVQVAIIPFNNFVKIDPATYKSKPWVNWGLNSGSGSGGAGDDGGSSSSGCNGGDHGGDNNDPCTPSSSTWTGCFTDRNQSYDIQNTAPGTNSNAYFYAVNCTITQLMPLSYDWTALNNKIDAMVAAGTTNQPIGLVWGWHALTSSDPLNAPALPAGTSQVIILLTDGLNTQDRWSTNQSYIDARQYKSTDGSGVCANIKAAGITIYTVLVMSGNSTILQNCASDSSKYFALTTAGQIVTTFNTIGTNLSHLRIAK